jgi:hypothetical protein
MTIAVLSLMTTLAGCSGSAEHQLPPVAVRALPPPPDFLQPVQPPNVRRGQDAREAAAQARGALAKANGRLSSTADWYAGIRRDYGQGGTK